MEKVKLLKEVKIRSGKFTLDGKVVEVEPLSLQAIGVRVFLQPEMLEHPEKLITENAPKRANAYILGKSTDEDSTVFGGIRGCTAYFPVLYLKLSR